MAKINKLEDFLFKNGYWIQGQESHVITTTAKWNKMINRFFKANPSKPITEKQIKDYVKIL